MKHEEDDLQVLCVSWFRLQYPKLARFLFHVPNGGSRSFRVSKTGARFSPEAQRLKKMGIRPGVSDLFLMIPNCVYHGLWIEMKSRDGRVSEAQIEFQGDASAQGFEIATIRSLEAFQKSIKAYLKIFEAGQIRDAL